MTTSRASLACSPTTKPQRNEHLRGHRCAGRARTPRTNGFVERVNRTLLDECFRVKGRENWYLEIAEIQRDLEAFMTHYNPERSHQGYRLGGRTPAQALREALGIDTLPSLGFDVSASPSTDTKQNSEEVTAEPISA